MARMKIPVVNKREVSFYEPDAWEAEQVREIATYLYTACVYSSVEALLRLLVPGLTDGQLNVIMTKKLHAIVAGLLGDPK